jgi:hypothetical protein
MPRKGPAYPITKEWQGWLRERIDEMIATGEIKSDAAFARRAKISPVALSEALKPGRVQTTVMEEIHRAADWPPPIKTPPIHVLRIFNDFLNLTEFEQGEWAGRLRGVLEVERDATRVDRDRAGTGKAPRRS